MEAADGDCGILMTGLTLCLATLAASAGTLAQDTADEILENRHEKEMRMVR